MVLRRSIAKKHVNTNIPGVESMTEMDTGIPHTKSITCGVNNCSDFVQLGTHGTA